MRLELRPRDRRALLLLALAVIVYGMLKIVVFPAHDRLALAADAAAQKQAELRKGQYAQLTELETKKVKEAESVLITAANASLVSAELQSLVETTGSKV